MIFARQLPAVLAMPLAAQVVGTWRLEVQPDLRPRMARATTGLKPADRERVRAALARNNVAPTRITLAHNGGWITLRFDDQPPLRLRDDGFAVPWRGPDGKDCLVSARLEGGALVHTLMGEDGMRRTVFRAQDGRLAVKVTVKAMLLAEPFEYVLSYRP